MVLPIKVFEAKEEASLESLFLRLKDFHEEAPYQTADGRTVNLVTQILDLELKEDSVYGIFSVDFMGRRYFRRSLVETPVTEEAPFWIKRFKNRIFVIVLAPSVARGVKKLLTGYVANKLNEILFTKPHTIVETRISDETLRKLHESNPQATKLIWFDDIDIPGVEKLCLAGSDVADTQLYHEYLGHGRIWYVVFEVQKRGIVVGITRNCVVTLFSKSSPEEFINYILEDLLTRLE